MGALHLSRGAREYVICGLWGCFSANVLKIVLTRNIAARNQIF